jgi:hypothetical protein
MGLGQRNKEFQAIQGLRERQFDEGKRQFGVGVEQFESEVDARVIRRREDRGDRKLERAADKEERDEIRDEGARRYSQEFGLRKDEAGRQAKRAAWESEDRAQKKRYEVLEAKHGVAMAKFNSGDTHGAIKDAIDMVNGQYPNTGENSGNSSRVIQRDMNPDHEIWQKQGPGGKFLYQDHDLVVLTQNGGILESIKTAKDLMGLSSKAMNYKQYSKDVKSMQSQVEKFNLSQKPFTDNKGTWIKEQRIENDQVVDEIVPYTEPTPLGGAEAKIEQAGLKPKQVSAAERKKMIGADIESGGAGGAKALKAQTEQFKKDMDMLLRHFAKGGTMLLVDDEGNLSKAGKSALSDATELWNKQKRGEALTTEESSKLAYARDAVQVYAVMQQSIKARYVKPGEAGKKAWGAYDY